MGDVIFLHNGEAFCRLRTIEQLGIGNGGIIQWFLRQKGGSNTDSEHKEKLEKSIILQLVHLNQSLTQLKDITVKEVDQLGKDRMDTLDKMDCDDILQGAETRFKPKFDQCNKDAQEGIDAIRATLTDDPTRDKRKLASIQDLETWKVEDIGEIEAEKEEFISNERKRKEESIINRFDAQVEQKKQKIEKLQEDIDTCGDTMQRYLPSSVDASNSDSVQSYLAGDVASINGALGMDPPAEEEDEDTPVVEESNSGRGLGAASIAADAGKTTTDEETQETENEAGEEDISVSKILELSCCVLLLAFRVM